MSDSLLLQARVHSLSLLHGIFPTQGSNHGLPHCGRILYQLSYRGSPRILEWVAFFFSQGIFPTQGSNPGVPHCRRILYQLSHKGSPRILEWVPCPFLAQESNWGLLHCRWILYQLSYQGSADQCLAINKHIINVRCCYTYISREVNKSNR